MPQDHPFRSLPKFYQHELVAYTTDAVTGLRAFIAIHSTALGPATGGTRFLYYPEEQLALSDALRLSQAMTYKCALADVPFGGGKGVIIADRKNTKTKGLLEAYARKINLLGGNYTTGEDVGVDDNDVKVMGRVSPYINGVTEKGGSLTHWTGQGLLLAIKAGLEHVYGTREINGRTFAIKGLGKIGKELVGLLYGEGGKITAADTNPKTAAAIKDQFPNIKFVSASVIHKQKVDVFCPCALSGDLNPQNISELDCKLVCGGANNQLSCPSDGKILHKLNILYIPDYVANAGGLIRAVAERIESGFSKKWVSEKVCNIFNTVSKVIKLSEAENIPTSEVADNLAKKKLKLI